MKNDIIKKTHFILTQENGNSSYPQQKGTIKTQLIVEYSSQTPVWDIETHLHIGVVPFKIDGFNFVYSREATEEEILLQCVNLIKEQKCSSDDIEKSIKSITAELPLLIENL